MTPIKPSSLPSGHDALAGLDEATLRYVMAMRVPFDLLRQAAGQLAGVLVLAVSTRTGVAGHPMLELARAARREAQEAVLATKPPPRGTHHHRHVSRAADMITLALDAAYLHRRGDDDTATDGVLRPLRCGFQELRQAAAAVPGFEVVDFAQGCCARRPGPLQATPVSAGQSKK